MGAKIESFYFLIVLVMWYSTFSQDLVRKEHRVAFPNIAGAYEWQCCHEFTNWMVQDFHIARKHSLPELRF